MNMPQPMADCYEFNPAYYRLTAVSSSRSNTPPSPSPPSTGVLDQVFVGQYPYTVPYCYDAQMQHFMVQAKPSHIHPQDIFSFCQYPSETEYRCIAPPDIHLTPPPSFAAPTQVHTEYQQLAPPIIDGLMLPNPSGIPSFELPKRKGERALARLQRSAVDPGRHWPCTQCIQKFTRKSDLTRHLKRHAGRKDYPCTAPSCPLPIKDRQFYRADARRRHWIKSPECEIAFYKTPEGVAWTKKNGNRRGVITPFNLEGDNEQYDENSDDGDSVYAE